MQDRIYSISGSFETVEGLESWALTDVTGGAVPLKKQLNSASRTFKSTRPFASKQLAILAKQCA